MLIAKVVLPIRLHQIFDYIVPDNLCTIVGVGQRIKVPFGNRQAIGIIISLSKDSEFELDKLKTIHSIIDNQTLFSAKIWQLLNWAANYYHYPLGEVLFHALPILLRQGKLAALQETQIWQLTEKGRHFATQLLSSSIKQQAL